VQFIFIIAVNYSYCVDFILIWFDKRRYCIRIAVDNYTTLFDNRCAILMLLTKAALAGWQAAHAL